MKFTIVDIKTSQSGKSDVITLDATVTKTTALGKSTSHKFFNHAVAHGTAAVKIGDEVELKLEDFNVRASMLTYQDGTEHESLWLEVK